MVSLKQSWTLSGDSVSRRWGIHYRDVSSPHLFEIFIPVWMRAKQKSSGLNMNKWINEGVSKGCSSWNGSIKNTTSHLSSFMVGEPSTSATLTPSLQKFYMCQLISIILSNTEIILVPERMAVWIKPSVGVCDKAFICFTQCWFHCMNIKYTRFQHQDGFFKLGFRHLIAQSHTGHDILSHNNHSHQWKYSLFKEWQGEKNTSFLIWKHPQDSQINIIYRCRSSKVKNIWKRFINCDHEEYIKLQCHSPKQHNKSQICTE